MTRLDLPDPPKIRGTNFRLQRIQAFNPLRGGHHQAVDMGEPVWLCDIETTPLSRAQGGEWKWLLAKRRGAIRTLMLYDASRPKPLAYHTTDYIDAPTCDSTLYTADLDWITCDASGAAAIAPWGTPRIVAVDRANSELDIEGFKPGAVLSDGDMGAWDDGPARRLHIIEGETVPASGACSIVVEPAPPSSATATLPVPLEMDRPKGEFVVMQASAPYSAPVTHQVSLQAAQVLRRS